MRRFGGSGRGVEHEGDGGWVETGGGDSSEMGSVTKKKGKQKSTLGIKRRATKPR